MVLVGRITKDAEVKQLKDERKVVSFSVAMNDYYKPKGSDQGVKTTLYVNCSYWIGTGIAPQLLKGSLVEITGRIYVNAYSAMDGEAKLTLNCHVSTIKIHSKFKNEKSENGTTENTFKQKVDDLPF